MLLAGVISASATPEAPGVAVEGGERRILEAAGQGARQGLGGGGLEIVEDLHRDVGIGVEQDLPPVELQLAVGVLGDRAHHRLALLGRQPGGVAVGVDQQEAADPFGMAAGVVDRQEAAQAVADQHEAAQPQGGRHRADRRRQGRHPEVAVARAFGFAVAGQVEGDAAQAGTEAVEHRRPLLEPAAQPVHEDQRQRRVGILSATRKVPAGPAT